ncbi:hypothetical protein D3C87_1896850 [compost metagenome]
MGGRCRQMLLDRALGNAHAFGDLSMGKIVETPEDKTLPASGWQIADRILQDFQPLPRDDPALDIFPLIGDVIVLERLEAKLGAPLPAKMVDR